MQSEHAVRLMPQTLLRVVPAACDAACMQVKMWLRATLSSWRALQQICRSTPTLLMPCMLWEIMPGSHPTHRSSTSQAFLSLSSSCLVQSATACSFSLPSTIRFTSLPP